MVGHADTKTWWRNFRGGHDLDVLVEGRWIPMRGRAVIGAESPDQIAPLVEAYLARFPSARLSLPNGARSALVVLCSPRIPPNPDLPDTTSVRA